MAKRKPKKNNQYKKQAWGALLLIVAVLLSLSILSFDVNDPVHLNAGDKPLEVNNWLGPLGASLSWSLMQWTLGYPIIVFSLILLLVALQIIRSNKILEIKRVLGYLFIWGVLFSIYLALPEAIEKQGIMVEYYPSGLVGGWLASQLVIYLGKVGALLVIISLSIIFLIITLKIELSKLADGLGGTLRKIGNGIALFFKRIADIWYAFRDRRAELKLKKQKSVVSKSDPPSDLERPPLRKKEDKIPVIDLNDTLGEQPPAEADHQDHRDLSVDQTPEAPAMIQTTLEDLIDDLDRKGDNAEIPAEPVEFEVKEEVVESELDYDDLVKESIARYKFPSIDLLDDTPEQDSGVTREELKANAELLELKLLDFAVKAKVVRVSAGPVITMYELQPAPGVKVSSIVNLANDLALALEARGIRIIAPIPGKAAVGIEIPNRNPQMVFLKSLIRSEKFTEASYELPLAIGKTINGESYIADLTKMPHLLIAGATGSGKSVGINTIIMSLLYSVNPGKVKFMMVDPKKLELSVYRDLREHYLIWRPDLDEEVVTKPNNAVSMLNSMVLEMEKRYDKLAGLGVRNIVDYNKKIKGGGFKVKEGKHQQLPYVVVLIDELADLMMVAAKEVETPIARLAQMARAVGIHLIVATQRPSVNVITGMIKANFPARIAYQVATKVDSRTVIDMNGAEQLLGNGDMLYLPPGYPKPIRLQNPFVATEEVEVVIEHISRQAKLPYYSIPQPASSSSGVAATGGDSAERDPLYEDAKAIVVQHQQGSISFLQRRLKIGYSRAARLIDEMEEEGIVSAADGSKAREVLITLQELA